MKTTKSPENAEVTPSKKKLKQARLPFKLLSDVSPKPDIPSTRKRKLSSPELEPTNKMGKILKENDIAEPVIISDEESVHTIENKNEKLPNPYVKIIDTARRKLQKSKKKKNSKKSSKVHNGSCEVQTDGDNKVNESMDVDELPNSENVLPKQTEQSEINEVNRGKINTSTNKELDIKVDSVNKICEIVSLEDSNNVSDKDPELLEDNCNDKVENECDQASSEETTTESPSKPEDDNSNSKQSEEQVTPKRSMRNRKKTEQNNNAQGSPNTKLNSSSSSVPSTPKSSQGDVSLNVSSTSANLTPKQVQKKLESAKKKEEKEKEKQEREKMRQQIKEEKAKLRQDKEEQKRREREEKEEAKRKEREEKEEQRRKEKEEKEKQKELEKKQKEEKEEQRRKEREEKEEQKRKEKEAKEEEKRKKQEALELEKQEQELKKKKAAEAFTNFFVPKQKSGKDQPIICSVNNSMLSNFTVKSDMRLAPLIRADLTDDKKSNLDNLLEKQVEDKLYLKCLKDGLFKPQFSGKTWPLSDKDEDDDDDVMIVEDAELPPIDGAGEILSSESAPREKLRPKLLSFHENRRPPYWGTWRKKSVSVKPRKPFGQDEKLLDYEVDSDEEWEEEQEGESVGGSVAGSDEEPDGDEYEVDNVVFVPHGYLSDEEATMDEDDVLSLSPETQQARLKHLETEFESEMKKPTEKLKPRMYGLLWETAEGGKPEKCADALWNYFKKMSMIMNDPTPLLLPSTEPEEGEKKKVKKKKQVSQADGEQKQKSPKSDKKKKLKPEEKETKTPKSESKKTIADAKKNQTSINMFLTKAKTS